MAPETRAGPSLRSPLLSEIERSGARYLFAVSVLSETDDGRVTTGDLRFYLDVSPASVTEMVSKLDDRGLVDYEKYQGTTLTRRGNALAAELAWRFCVVSTFFESELGVDLDDRTAFTVAFVLPEDGIIGLSELVNAHCLGLCPEAGAESTECASC